MKNRTLNTVGRTIGIMVAMPIVILIWCVGWTLYMIGDLARKTRKRELREMIDEYNTRRET